MWSIINCKLSKWNVRDNIRTCNKLYGDVKTMNKVFKISKSYSKYNKSIKSKSEEWRRTLREGRNKF